MTMGLLDLLERCRDGIGLAARESYREGCVDRFEGCYCMVGLKDGAQIEIAADRRGGIAEVLIYHKDGNELPNLEGYIKDWLEDNAGDLWDEWQDECDNDDWRDVDRGCDPAFPRYGDFERWAYGR